MLYLAVAIATLGLSILLAAIILSRAIVTAAGKISSALRTNPRQVEVAVQNPARAPQQGPDPEPRVGAPSPMDDLEAARLEIQKRAFDVPALIAVGGQVSERMGDQDIVGISDGIKRNER